MSGMIRSILLAAAAPISVVPAFAIPLAAQAVSQEQIQTRYDRALAAGYKALFLCGAIANAERNGAARTPDSVMEWELTGIQPPLDGIVADLPYRVLRDADQRVAHVEVDWTDDMPPRFAEAGRDSGCRLAPIGLEPSMPETIGGAAEAPLTVRMGLPITRWRSLEELARMEALFDRTIDGAYGNGSRTTALVVSVDGKSLDAYADGFDPLTPQRTWSVAKSIAASIVGAAVHRGEARVDQRLAWPAWRWDARRSISIDDFLRMASGRYSDTPGNRTDPLYYGGATVEETATGWPLVHEPGTVFRYANNDTLMAMKAIEGTFDDHPPSEFFAKLGMKHTVAETDWAGDYILSSQVWSTARDLAKLGQLYLDDGVLPSGERVLPEGWTKYVSSPSGPQPEGRSWGYGAGFWLFNDHEGIPSDTFFMAGNRGQYVVIVPSRDIVIVRRGEDPTGSGFDIEAFTRDVLAALAE